MLIQEENRGFLIATRLCKTMDVSLSDGIFAGRLLEWVAEAGSLFAMRLAETSHHMALYRIDNLRITKPVRVGTLLDFYADEITYGNTSVSFKVKGYFQSGTEFLTLECTYVQLAENGEKIPLKVKNN